MRNQFNCSRLSPCLLPASFMKVYFGCHVFVKPFMTMVCLVSRRKNRGDLINNPSMVLTDRIDALLLTAEYTLTLLERRFTACSTLAKVTGNVRILSTNAIGTARNGMQLIEHIRDQPHDLLSATELVETSAYFLNGALEIIALMCSVVSFVSKKAGLRTQQSLRFLLVAKTTLRLSNASWMLGSAASFYSRITGEDSGRLGETEPTMKKRKKIVAAAAGYIASVCFVVVPGVDLMEGEGAWETIACVSGVMGGVCNAYSDAAEEAEEAE